MGYALVVKGADFSAQSIGRVTYQEEPTPVIGGWIFGIATDNTVNERINKTQAGSSQGPWMYGSDYGSNVSFEGKTVSKIFIIPKSTGFTLRYGICNKNLTTGTDFSGSKEEKGTINITSGNINTPIDITPFTVPSGSTVYFEGNGQYDFLNCDASSMSDNVARGIPGTISNYYNDNIRKFANTSICIDFYIG